jgi:antitoxin YefM
MNNMPVVTTYTQARASFAALCAAATEDREVVIIRRRGSADVALIAADELRSLEETAHLLRSPKNAERLLRALLRALHGTEHPQDGGISGDPAAETPPDARA